jgi:CBS domain-containing protein
MTTDVICVSSSDTVDHAKTLMRFAGVHQVVVVDGRTVKGILASDQIGERPSLDTLTVHDVMTRNVLTASPDLTLRKAANILRGSGTPALPVLHHGRVVGTLTAADLLDFIGRGAERRVRRERTRRPRSR